ncbi:hypothetical protein A5886_000026 [Enterococcus sp. 8G7_MSG3316]|uniref:RNA-binding protein KhpB n=1 Tax=Candidatus Enterococcus testudinis TaxID=1834191 RepID=A0A242A212_9ENTE|nr:RNA-binding cell elongation regulator Jag/EloR [Enterococcus sp. 8G7_MSG3316]OTN74982.1 hypothetical protein A5886_000026 [Enterococcus sp. 8G7_MSG3316]
MPIYESLTVEEAIQEGLQVLGLTKDQAMIDILDEGKKGFLGMGKKPARVSIEKAFVQPEPITDPEPEAVIEQTSDTDAIVETVTEGQISEQAQQKTELSDDEALAQLGLYLTNISNALQAPAFVKTVRQDGLIVFQLETDKQGILIGKHGKTLNALQYLSQVYIHRIAKNKLSVVINVGDYREKRQAILERLASRTAEKVKRTGRPVFLEPMPAFERKQIHSVLSKDTGVQTHSEGDEPYRYLVVEPTAKKI